MILSRRWTLAPIALALLAWPADAAAQISKFGVLLPAASGGTSYARTVDTGYDGVHNVFLTVTTEHQTGRVFGTFATGSGSVGSGFRIDTSGNFPFGPAVTYSPQADVFLVTWVNDAAQVRGRLVRYGTGVLGAADILLATGGRKTWSPATAYSATSNEFLVSWSTGAGPNWIVRVSTGGSTIGSPVQTTGNVWTQEPALTWNSSNNEFMLVYAQEMSVGWQVRAQRISQGQLVGGPATVHAAGSTKQPDVQYNAQTNTLLVSWFQGSPYGIYGRLLNADGSAAGSAQPLLPSTYGSYDANSLSYNSVSGTFVIASVTSQNNQDTIGGAEISGAGVPGASMRFVEAPAGTGNRRYPRSGASSTDGRFMVVFNKSQSAFFGQLLTSAAGGGSTPPPPPPPPPTPTAAAAITAAEADFTGDSKPDLLWRHDNGAVALWQMDGLSAAQVTYLGPGPVDLAWQIAGTGDLNGDGKPEIIWRHSAGWLYAWFMNGTSLQQGAYLTPNHIDTSLWKIVAVADMNGDGKADLIWQHDAGYLVVWYMSGTSMIGSSSLTPASVAGNDWKIVGAGDLNGDLKPDLVWQQTSTNRLGAWIMNGTVATSTVLLNPSQVQPGWKVRGVVDLNGDGVSDLVWQHTTGAVGAWLMQGATATTMTSLVPGGVNPEWDLAGPR